MSTIQLRSIEPDADDEGSSVDSSVGLRFVALVDSGATHALRPAVNDSEWSSASPVLVSLAGKETSAMRSSPSGTLLLPPLFNAQTIVPLGSVIQQLGYRLDWTATRCRLIAPSGRTFRLRVKEGCPEIVESEALVLISKLEQRRLDDLKVLEANVGESASRIKAVKVSMSKGWWEQLQDYVTTGSTTSTHLAVSAAPFFADVPLACLRGLVEDVSQASGWELLKGLTHLNRHKRRALLQAPEWVVHLYAGAPGPKPFASLESRNVALLEFDIIRSADQDVLKSPAWRVLFWGAVNGKVSHVMGGPSCKTFSVLRHREGGPPPVRGPMDLYGLPELSASDRQVVDRDTALFVRQVWLHAVATEGRKATPPPGVTRLEVGFLLEQPMLVDRYLPPSHALFGEVSSFWNTGLWNSYADEAGLFEVHVNQGDFGHVTEKPTTLGTNYADLRLLEVLNPERSRKPSYQGKSADLARWAPGLTEAILIAIKNWPKWFRVAKTKAQEWHDHVKNNHQPFRKDCSVCVRTAGSGRRHTGVVHPSQYFLPTCAVPCVCQELIRRAGRRLLRSLGTSLLLRIGFHVSMAYLRLLIP